MSFIISTNELRSLLATLHYNMPLTGSWDGINLGPVSLVMQDETKIEAHFRSSVYRETRKNASMYSTAPLPRRMWPVSSSHNSLENPPLPCQDAGRQRGIIAHFCCRTPINVSGSFLCGGIFISWGCSQIPDLTGQSSTPFRFLPTCRLETERTGKPALRHTRRG